MPTSLEQNSKFCLGTIFIIISSTFLHVWIFFNWIHDGTELKRFQLKKIHTGKNAVDMMTKVVPRQKLEFCSKLTSMGSHYGSKVTSTFSHMHGSRGGDLMGSIPNMIVSPTFLPTCLSFAYKLKANALRFIILSFNHLVTNI